MDSGTGRTSPSGSSASQDRLEVNINRQTADALRGYSQKHGLSISESVRRMIIVADYILAFVDDGKNVEISGRGTTDRVMFDFL